MSNETQHQRMVRYLGAATAHLQSHREAVGSGVTAHLDEAGRIGSTDTTQEEPTNGHD